MEHAHGFGDRLTRAIAHFGPLCVGIDPHPGLLEQWNLPDSADGLESFAHTVLNAAEGRVAAVKPQVALFERHGSAGFAVLEDFLAEAAQRQVLVIADAKRGDIGSTMSAYADSWLSESSLLGTDSVTLSPYLGFESLRPALTLAEKNNRGTFVLALTSNPEGKTVQHVGKQESVAKRVIELAIAENNRVGFETAGPCGLVIGATVGEALKNLDINLSLFNGPILAPGYGAQGASAEDLYRVFLGIENRVLVNSSREILSQGPAIGELVYAIEEATADLNSARVK